ncbi:MAG: chorismate mutase [Oscillospiraceae bacterium]|nr:chorismate mutase [Oscillospiraceae bacterium]
MPLDEIRQEIDAIDNELALLFQRRMALTGEVAREKRQSGGPILRREREEAILERLGAGMPLTTKSALNQLYSTIFRLSRGRQMSLMDGEECGIRQEIAAARERGSAGFPGVGSVACQGIRGAYSHIAAQQLFSEPNVVFLRTFDAVFRAVECGLCRYGVLPIENSTYGSVTQVYDLLKRHSCSIVRALRLPIDHCLLSRAKFLKDVKEIYSHEQALGQCAEFLEKLGKHVAITVCENTAVAARMAAESGREDVAAISSEECAELYGLRVLKRSIQREARNETRFICIARQPELFPEANRCSVLLSLQHRPGSLAELLQLPAALGINLTKLENRPAPGREFEFLFYLDLECDASQPETVDFLERMAQLSEAFTFLGSYREMGGIL